MITNETQTQDDFETNSLRLRLSGIDIDAIRVHEYDDGGDATGPHFVGMDETGARVVVWPVSKRVRRSVDGGRFKHAGYIDELELVR